MKKIVALIMTLIMMFALASCGAKEDKSNVGSSDSVGSGSVQTETELSSDEEITGGSAPFQEYESMEDASAAAGFDLVVPETPAGLSEQLIQVYDTDPAMIEIIYSDGEESVTIRKEASGSDGERDISGVYVEYEEQTTEELNGNHVNLSGENQLVYVATWLSGDCNYSVYSDAGMSRSDLLDLIVEIQ